MIDTSFRSLQAVCEVLKFDPTHKTQVIADWDWDSGILRAGVLYDVFNGASVNCHIYVNPVHKPAREWWCAIFHYPFEVLKVKKIVGQVPSDNSQAVLLDTHFGFELEATIKDYFEGADLLVYTMTRAQCRVLNSRVWEPVMKTILAKVA